MLCVTHLATIAVRADNHLRIQKETQAGRTVTRVDRVTGAVRREEIARMLAGDRTGDASLQHAGELLARYSGKTCAARAREEMRGRGAPEGRG